MSTTSFIGEPIQVLFDEPPAYRKTPHCPNRIVWREELLAVVAVVQEWREFERRGRMSQNMRPENLQRAQKRGSWGVGRFFFRVQLDNGRVFDLYYDRSPHGSDERLGSWHLFREILDTE